MENNRSLDQTHLLSRSMSEVILGSHCFADGGICD